MSTHAFFCDDDARPVTVEVRPIKGHEPKIVISLSVPFADISLHLDDLRAGYRLYERLGNALQAARDAQDEASGGIDLESDPQPDGGTVGVQPGNPTMDAHGPDPSVSYHSQAMDAARASIAHGPQTEAPSAYVAEVQRAAAAADARRRRGDR